MRSSGRPPRGGTSRAADLLSLAGLLVPVAVIAWRSRSLGAACATLETPLDARLVGYLLEWGYLHLQGATAPGAELWSPPFFYPIENVLAYSENLFSGYATYFPLRWLGLGPSSALFVFHLLQLALTPVVSYLCLRKLRLGPWPSLVAAAVFSWGWIRYFHYAHLQFSAGYPIPLFFTALYFAFHRRRPWAVVVAAWTFLFAWHFSLYTALFLALGTLALVVAQLVVPGGAREIVRVARSYGRMARSRPYGVVACLALTVAAGLLILPSAASYAEVHQGIGPALDDEVRTYWGNVLTWVHPPSNHPLVGGFHTYFPKLWGGVWEKQAFLGWLGFLGLVLPGAGLVIRRRRIYALWPRSLVVASGAGLATLLIFSSYSGTWLETPFWFLHAHFPGLGGVRAPTRIAMVVSWFAAVCLAVHVQRLGRVRHAAARGVVTGGLGLALLAEGLAPLPRIVDRCEDEAVWRETERHLCQRIPREDIGTVLFLPANVYSFDRLVQHTLAMNFSLACGVNVVNGYSGRQPELLQPLFQPDPSTLPCPSLRAILDRAHERSGKGILIHVDRSPPLGHPSYPAAALARCLEPCLAPDPRWFVPQPGRPAEVFVTDPAARCEGPPPR